MNIINRIINNTIKNNKATTTFTSNSGYYLHNNALLKAKSTKKEISSLSQAILFLRFSNNAITQ